MPGASMVLLGREELDVWLGEPEDFILAVLRDIYTREEDVRLWLNTPRPELGRRVPVDMLSLGRAAEIEEILIEQWNGR